MGKAKVLAFAGSTRSDSVNKKLIREALSIASEFGAEVSLIDLRELALPLYDGDLEAKEGLPVGAQRLRALMMESQLIFIATPEYNGSLSGVLKNAIDWASRKEGGMPSRDAFYKKLFVIMAASPSNRGGAKAIAHLKDVLEVLGGDVQPDSVAIPGAYSAFDPQGHLVDSERDRALRSAIEQALQKTAVL